MSAEMDELEKSTEEIHELINTVENHRYFEDAERIDGKELTAKSAQLKELKMHIKEAFSVQTVSKEMFLKYLGQNMSSWPTQNHQVDKQVLEISNQIKSCKTSIDQEKAVAEELVACAEESYAKLKTSLSELKEVLKRHQKQKEIQDLRTVEVEVPENIKEAIQELKEARKQVESETALRRTSLAEAKACHDKLQQDVLALKEKIGKQEEDRGKSHTITLKRTAVLKEKIKQNTEVLEYVKSLSGLRVLPTEYPDTIRLEFSQRQDGDLSLHLTMHLAADHCGRVYLKGAEVDNQSLSSEDLIEPAVEWNDPVLLVQSLRERWIAYYPIVSEIKKLSQRHAVDWIQKEGVVRILLGKRGTVICTLSVPQSYPWEGSVSLISVTGGHGEDNAMEVDESEKKKSLQQWVDYLEKKYENS
ncbi:uncharacterized protein LOC125651471 [Ostrea edulis]|uniref:uncharacterized protein LOC125651471 n=1 Tax=Ostrea edulis TaxID=37623 RepID=UPI0024AF9BF2|nr:uncharacterized protein LOC125651471 [Ostrea edulis]